MQSLIEFLKNSPTSYNACEQAKATLAQHGFQSLSEADDWNLAEGGKYYIARGGSIVAFTVDSLDDFAYKIVASHTDSPMLKLKENPVAERNGYASLNVEPYGGGIWYTFLDRPLKLAGRVIKREGGLLLSESVISPFTLTIPSLAIHQNRGVNDGFAINKQIDLQPLLGVSDGETATADMAEILKGIAGEGVISYDLFLVNADLPYTFGLNDEFLSSPRLDNLTSVYASLQALISHESRSGICVAACLNNEEVGSLSYEGADGDFLENVLRRIAYAFRFDDNEYYKALASSFLLSVDNAHAVHPNHPETSDPTNKTALGGGVVIKSHAGKAYITDAMASAVVKTVFDNAGVKYQYFANRSDVKSGGTLGSAALRHVGVLGADIGLAQLAMHSACECLAHSDIQELERGLSAYYAVTLRAVDGGVSVE